MVPYRRLGWSHAEPAIYPEPSKRRDAGGRPRLSELAGKDTVRTRPEDNPGMRGDTVRAGLHVMSRRAPPEAGAWSTPSGAGLAALRADTVVGRAVSPASNLRGSSARDERREPGARSPQPGACIEPPSRTYPVVWWAPARSVARREAPVGLRREDLIRKDVSPSVVADARSALRRWVTSRADAIADGSAPSLQVRTITEFAHSGAWPAAIGEMPPVDVIELPRDGTRPKGRRFGTLVHAVLATTPLDADLATLTALATLEGRILGAPDEEVTAAAALAARVLAHPLLAAARAAEAHGKCRREVPVTLTLDDGRLLEGVVDLAFEHEGAWTVVDFKTDEDPSREMDAYSRQVGLYAAGLERVCGGRSRGALLVI